MATKNDKSKKNKLKKTLSSVARTLNTPSNELLAKEIKKRNERFAANIKRAMAGKPKTKKKK